MLLDDLQPFGRCSLLSDIRDFLKIMIYVALIIYFHMDATRLVALHQSYFTHPYNLMVHLDPSHFVGSYNNNTSRGTKDIEICWDLPWVGGLHNECHSLSSHCGYITYLVSIHCDCFPSFLILILNYITQYGHPQYICCGQMSIWLLLFFCSIQPLQNVAYLP